MATSDAHKRASYKYNAGRDNIMIRPTKETGHQIRQAAQAVGKSVQAYILGRIAGDGDAPAPAPQAPQYLTPEALDKATQAAQAAGEELTDWITRAINDTAQRDSMIRQLKR